MNSRTAFLTKYNLAIRFYQDSDKVFFYRMETSLCPNCGQYLGTSLVYCGAKDRAEYGDNPTDEEIVKLVLQNILQHLIETKTYFM